MNNILILGISILILIIFFLIIILMIGKSKIQEIIVPLDISKQQINDYLRQKYKLFKEMTKFIKDNLSIKEEAFKEFLDFNSKECSQIDLINLLNKTTYELNEYVDNYDELLKNKDFLDLKKKLYDIEIKLEACIDFYNNKIILYNDLKTNGPTSFSTKFFEFDEFDSIEQDKKEISRLINLN